MEKIVELEGLIWIPVENVPMDFICVCFSFSKTSNNGDHETGRPIPYKREIRLL
jgi:hypothetical protein